jgi:tetratricopeptide (TPR) repeat protein
LLFLGLEAALRLFGYGYPPELFQEIVIDGERYVVQNDAFGRRFFPPALVRYPEPFRFKADKPENTVRIFVLGESAAMGDPEPAYGPARYLEVLLENRFPDVRFEIVNVAFTAINSHVIRVIAKECARREGDWWLIYMGNNEMVGPFGAATVFGTRTPPLAFARFIVDLQVTRIGQLLVATTRALRRTAGEPSSWQGMAMFDQIQVPPGSSERQWVYDAFEANLEEILHTGLGSGARIVLNTMAVNLKDCPPFRSATPSDLTASQFGELQRLEPAADGHLVAGEYAAAAAGYEQAAALDPHSAEIQFRLGSCLLALGNPEAARPRLQQACDNDALPFRADSAINTAITNVAAALAHPNLQRMDLASDLVPAPQIAGADVFYEHVHFNFDGAYLVGLAWAKQMSQSLPRLAGRTATPGWATQEACERRLALTDWNRALVVHGVLERMKQPPLANQFDHTNRVAILQAHLDTVLARMTAATASSAVELYEAELALHPDDPHVWKSYAYFLQSSLKLEASVAAWQRVETLRPGGFLPAYQIGNHLVALDKPVEAERHFRRALSSRPNEPAAWFGLGASLLAEDKAGEAAAAFGCAHRLRPDEPRYLTHQARALFRAGQPAEGKALLEDQIATDPNCWQAHLELADAMVKEERIPEAIAGYEVVVRLKPDHALAHLNLGVMRVRQGDLVGGLRAMEDALELEPENRLAQNYVRQVRERLPLQP